MNDIVKRLRPKTTDSPNFDTLPKETETINEKQPPSTPSPSRETKKDDESNSEEPNIISKEIKTNPISDQSIKKINPTSDPTVNFFDEASIHDPSSSQISQINKNKELSQSTSIRETSSMPAPPNMETAAEKKWVQKEQESGKGGKKNTWKNYNNAGKSYGYGFNNKYGVPKKQLDYGKMEGVSFFEDEKAFQPEDVEEIIATTVDTYLKKK